MKIQPLKIYEGLIQISLDVSYLTNGPSENNTIKGRSSMERKALKLQPLKVHSWVSIKITISNGP